MKTIKLAFALIIAALAMTACVEDKVYEGPNTIEAVSINPDAPTSFDDVVVTAKVSGLLKVTKAVLRYSVNDDFVDEIEMAGNGNTFTATIPAQEDGDKVSYAVIITNEAGYTTTTEKDYTVGDKPSDYSKLVINEVVWVGEAGEIIMGHGYFCIVGAKNTPGEGGSGPNPRPMTKGLSAKKSVLFQVFDPNSTLVTKFERGEKQDGWGNQSLPENKQTWSRCPNGTGKFMIADKTLGAQNPDTGEEDETVVQ